MSNSYEVLKNDKNASFFNYPTDDLTYKVIKNQGKVYYLPSYTVANQSNISCETMDILAKNSYSNVPFVNGDRVDFDLPSQHMLYYKLYLSFDLKNENDATALTTVHPCFYLEKVSILKNGNEISSVDDIWTYLKNMEHYNPLNLEFANDSLNVSANNILTTDSIATNTTKSFLIDLPISLRKSNILASLPNNLTIRVKFRKGVSTSAVTDSDIIISNLKIICKYIDTPDFTVRNILSLPCVDHFINKPYHYTRILNNLTSGTETYIDLDVKHNISQFFIYVQDSNPTNANHLSFYGLNNLYLTNASGLNILNSKKLTNLELNNELFEVFNKENKFYFYRKLNKLYLLDFTSHEHSWEKASHVGSESFKSGVFRLYFTPTQTVATSVTVHVLAIIPSLITIKNGDYTESYN